jgi:transporter family-2 protein
MGRFGERVGTLEAFGFATALTAILALGALLVARRSVAGYGAAVEAPAWMWTGGIWGFVVVLTITFVTPRLGATATIGLLIAGQLAMGAVIDRYGLFGLEKIEIGWIRLLGIALLAVGAALSLKK